MHNLERKIAEWRQQMADGGIKDEAVLDELENHLREDVERQSRLGTKEEAALETAIRRIGQSGPLRIEFTKIEEARLAKVMGIACCVFASLYSLLLLPRLLTIQELTFGQRILGLAAVAVTLLSIASWRFSYRYLPVIRNRRARKAIGIACAVAGLAWVLIFANLLPNIIVPYFLGSGASADSIRGHVLIGLRHAHVLTGLRHAALEEPRPVFMIGLSLVWALALAAILGGIAYGLEEAARRRAERSSYV